MKASSKRNAARNLASFNSKWKKVMNRLPASSMLLSLHITFIELYVKHRTLHTIRQVVDTMVAEIAMNFLTPQWRMHIMMRKRLVGERWKVGIHIVYESDLAPDESLIHSIPRHRKLQQKKFLSIHDPSLCHSQNPTAVPRSNHDLYSHPTCMHSCWKSVPFHTHNPVSLRRWISFGMFSGKGFGLRIKSILE